MTRHLAPTRRIGLLLLASLVAVVLPAADPSAPEAVAQEAAPAGDACSGQGPLRVDDAYVQPAWSDGAGWSAPDQFETIMSGDVDGDGRGELVGRNAHGLEVFTWQEPQGTGDKAYDPDPGQWVQVIPTGDTPTFRTVDGWWDPSRYSTFRLADWDGRPGDELLARSDEGLQVWRWSAPKATWEALASTELFADSAGWGQSGAAYHGVWLTGDVDGNGTDELVTRGAGGIEVASSEGGSARATSFSGLLADDGGWDAEVLYSTVRLGDVDGDGADELLVRGRDGLLEFDLDVATGTWTQGPTIGDWSDAAGWADETHRGTIQVGDVDGDGRDDVVGRSPEGIDAWTLDAGGAWVRLASRSGFTDAEGWTPLQNSLTVQLADVLPAPGLEVIGRSGAGVVTYARQGGAWAPQPGVIDAFSDADDWGTFTQEPNPDVNLPVVPEDVRYATIRPVTTVAGRPQVVIGRDAVGIRTYRADGSDPSAPYPSYTDLKDLPNDAPVSDLGVLSPEGRVYWHINAVAARQFWPDDPDRTTTIVDKFADESLDDTFTALHSSLAAAVTGAPGGDGFNPGNGALQALNVPRDTYERVLQDVADWTLAVTDTWEFLLGNQGLKAVVEQAFLENLGDVDAIVPSFEVSGSLVALVNTLIRGVLALVGAAAVFFGAVGGIVVIINAVASLAATGIVAGLGYWDPNGSVKAEAATLKRTMKDNLCSASRFADDSYQQIVGDYGLLMATQRTFDATSVLRQKPEVFDNAVGVMRDAQYTWIWQQFGNRSYGYNFWIGWCDFGFAPGCTMGDEEALRSDPYAFWAPEGDVVYKVIGERDDGSLGNCRYDVVPRLGLPDDEAALVFDAGALIAPRRTDGLQPGRPNGPDFSNLGEPIANNIGVSGWRLGTQPCQ